VNNSDAAATLALLPIASAWGAEEMAHKLEKGQSLLLENLRFSCGRRSQWTKAFPESWPRWLTYM